MAYANLSSGAPAARRPVCARDDCCDWIVSLRIVKAIVDNDLDERAGRDASEEHSKALPELQRVTSVLFPDVWRRGGRGQLLPGEGHEFFAE